MKAFKTVHLQHFFSLEIPLTENRIKEKTPIFFIEMFMLIYQYVNMYINIF